MHHICPTCLPCICLFVTIADNISLDRVHLRNGIITTLPPEFIRSNTVNTHMSSIVMSTSIIYSRTQMTHGSSMQAICKSVVYIITVVMPIVMTVLLS